MGRENDRGGRSQQHHCRGKKIESREEAENKRVGERWAIYLLSFSWC